MREQKCKKYNEYFILFFIKKETFQQLKVFVFLHAAISGSGRRYDDRLVLWGTKSEMSNC